MSRFMKGLVIFSLTAGLFGAYLAYYHLPQGVPVLAYHKVSNDDSIYSIDPDLFERQLQYLAENGYTTLTLSQLSAGLNEPETLPPKPVVITFDDGYTDNYTTALPIMKKYGMRGAIFITTDRVGQPGYLTWEQINTLQSYGIDIGSHTISHRPLPSIPSAEWQQEIRVSKAMLDQNLAKPITFLAYPHGAYTSSMLSFIKESGYQGAFTGATGLNFKNNNSYELKRISILRSSFDLWSFRLRLTKANLYSLVATK